MKKLKNNKKIVILGISIIVILFMVLLFFVLRPQIKFNKNFKEIEYGTEYTYEDMIESVQPKDAEIIYPEVLATEVGKYKLTFNFKKDDKVYSDQFSFVIKDTKTPKLTLYFMDENIQVRLNDTNVDVLSNILDRCANGTLKTNAKLMEKYGLTPQGICYMIKDNWVVQLLVWLLSMIASGFVGVVITNWMNKL